MATRGRAALLAALCLCGLAATVDAAVAWRSQSAITTRVASPLAQLAQGAGADRSHFVTGFALSANRTSFAATISGRAGGAVVVHDLADLASRDASARNVTLSATQVTNAEVSELTWTVRNGSATVATLDARSSSPSVSFTLPAGATYALDLRVTLVPGAGHDDADLPLDLRMAVR